MTMLTANFDFLLCDGLTGCSLSEAPGKVKAAGSKPLDPPAGFPVPVESILHRLEKSLHVRSEIFLTI